ncbi:hypothetical protein, partial [Marinobacter goseongensis]|uniref:hypothetical protein n=1 Tax=Marinobacter goseongensis TaxID=453838 RepID=UPI002006D22A
FDQVMAPVSADGALRSILACKVTDSGNSQYRKNLYRENLRRPNPKMFRVKAPKTSLSAVVTTV